MEWVASSLHAWLGLQSMQCYYQQHKRARSFRWKTKSAFCACAITFRFYSTTPLFSIQAPTCFGSSLPSSGSFLDPPELHEIQIEWVVYHMCGYVTCAGLSWFCLLCFPAECTTDGTTTIWHTGYVTTHYMIYHPFHL